jgi:arylformamidase
MTLHDLSRPFDMLPPTNGIQTHMDMVYMGNLPPVQGFVRPGVLVDVRGYLASGAFPDLSAISDGCAVVLRTGWEDRFGTDDYDPCPDLGYLLIDALLDRGAKLLLVDSPGLQGGARGEEHNRMDTHVVERGGVAVEHLCNLEGLPQFFTLYCFPLAVQQLNWLPARVVAGY